jgi:hypothetical protein
MRKYVDYAMIWDLLLAIIISSAFYIFQDKLRISYNEDNINNFIISLITIASTLIGFLLAIITIIVTFKKGFDDSKPKNSDQNKEFQEPEMTVFEKSISKENKFYGTPIHKKVIDVFVYATYEIGIVIILLLLIQFDLIGLNIIVKTAFCLAVFILVAVSIARSLFIFKLFLAVHIHDKGLTKYK